MRIPRDLSGADLVKRLGWLGYEVTRQTGNPFEQSRQGKHHVTIPNHDPPRIGTLAAILDGVAAHHGLTREIFLQRLLG